MTTFILIAARICIYAWFLYMFGPVNFLIATAIALWIVIFLRRHGYGLWGRR